MPGITTRHLLGGFFGGVLGILACGLIHPILLPLGCVIGVVLGFWHDKVYATLRKEWLDLASKYPPPREVAAELPELARALWSVTARKTRTLLKWVLVITFSPIWFPVMIIKGAHAWLSRSPIRRARVLRKIAVFLIFGGQVALVHAQRQVLRPDLALSVLVGMCAAIMGTLISTLTFSGWGDKEQVARLRRLRHRYTREGPAKFLAKECGALLWNEAVGILIMIIGGFITFVGATIWGYAICAPIIMAFTAVRLLTDLAPRRQHWLCLGATLLTTISSAVYFKHYLSGTTLWLIALGTGVVSGVIAELARQTLGRALRRHAGIMTWAKVPIMVRTDQLGKKILERIGPVVNPILRPVVEKRIFITR